MLFILLFPHYKATNELHFFRVSVILNKKEGYYGHFRCFYLGYVSQSDNADR